MKPAEAGAAIAAVGLTKRFGSVLALDRLDVTLLRGESIALFGPNGAGKTTLIRLLSMSLRPDGGRFHIAGLDPRRQDREARRSIGVISHRSFLYDDLSARQNLEFFARLYGVQEPERRASELLALVELSRRADDPVGTFSRGMQQRVSLVRALVHDPPIVFLDEPFTGLDPYAAQLFRATLERLRTEGRSVLLVTHNLTQGLELSDRWIILSRGRIVDSGPSAATDRGGFEASYFDRVAGRAAP